jgi:hypothetical protein
MSGTAITGSLLPCSDRAPNLDFIKEDQDETFSGGPGISGTWKEVHFAESAESGLLTIAISGDSVAFKETDAEKPTVCKLDGTEVKLYGTSTMAIKLDGSHTLKVTYRTDGKIRRENTFELSPDGKTIKETDVTPDPSPSTTSMLLHKS